MPKRMEMHPAHVKRRILVVDDEQINCDILSDILQEQYDIISVNDGDEAMEILCAEYETISLVLLDLMMPRVSGIEVLHIMRNDPDLQHIPVIVMTSDQSAEVESLRLGAVDFIPKPYAQPEVIQARVDRIIELYEDQQTIRSTERDSLTGLYHQAYFFRYGVLFDQRHPDAEMDAIVIDISHFRMLNERYGKNYGDSVLRHIAQRLQGFLSRSNGIACRQDADTFLVYCLHGCDYQAMLDDASVTSAGPGNSAGFTLRLRMGVYPCADKSIDIERRFDRARLAADTMRNNYAQSISLYDSTLHDTELFAELLLEDFPAALAGRQFQVYYQPKFDIRPDASVLSSAEALVRWNHPTLGLMSPGTFIPLLESKGLIPQLDRFVWREVAAQIRDWKRQLGVSVPVAVNISRLDLYDPDLPDHFLNLTEEYHLSPTEYLLEITETAYTQDTDQIISAVQQLRSMGFRVEMDNFGAGYSSLNMLSSLPIDALKLDMHFIHRAFQGARDLKVLELVIDIARYLNVPIIALGVETSEQLHALRAMGCDYAQGYLFSRPIPPEAFQPLLEERKQHLPMPAQPAAAPESQRNLPSLEIANALSSGFESVYYVDVSSGHYVEFSSNGQYKELKIQSSGSNFFRDSQKNLKRVVYPADRKLMANALNRSFLLHCLKQEEAFTLTYRLVINDEPIWYTMRASMSSGEGPEHLVIGVSRADESTREGDQNADAQFNSISQSLSSDFVSIYYVDLTDDSYVNYTTPSVYQTLPLLVTGQHFFQESRSNAQAVVYFEDLPKVDAVLDKERLLRRLEGNPSVVLDYRLVFGDQPVYYRMKITMDDHQKDHVVFGVCDISSQLLLEREYHAADKNSITYSLIAQALSQDFYRIYYVNMDTGHFIQFSNQGPSHQMIPEKTGDDFFQTAPELIRTRVAPEDQDSLLSTVRRENLRKKTAEGRVLSVSVCAVAEEQKFHINFKALRLAEDDSHLVIGLRNIEAQAQWEREYEVTKAERTTYSRIARALAQDYFSIYYVDVESDDFVMYAPTGPLQELHAELRGTDFFHTIQDDLPLSIYQEDLTKAAQAWQKDTILRELRSSNRYSTSFRLLVNREPVYVSMKAIRLQDGDDHHIIIGISNIDDQVKRDQAFAVAQEMALRDDLTGVKNKRAYSQSEQKLNQQIMDGTAAPFGVVVCDINDLKLVNDTEGHNAGDAYIRSASSILCNTFSRSPVYRIGGDEFVILLTGHDYRHRRFLMKQLGVRSRREHSVRGLPLLSFGLAEYRPGDDEDLSQVFARADSAMYQHKSTWKRKTSQE